MAEGVYMCGKDKAIWECVLVGCPFILDLVEPFAVWFPLILVFVLLKG